MKKVTLFLALAFVLISCAEPKTREIVFKSTNGDVWANIGVINEADGIVPIKVIIPNNNNDTLIAKRSMESCSCFHLEGFEQRIAAPGENIIANITYNPAYRRDIQKEYIRIEMSDKSISDIYLHADVVPCKHPIEEDHKYLLGEGLRTSHKSLIYGNIKQGETKDMYIYIANGLDIEADVILDPRGENTDCLRFRQLGRVEADSRDTLHFKFTMPQTIQPSDSLEFILQPIVNGVETETAIKVKAICE